jgi:four helix bundle protein
MELVETVYPESTVIPLEGRYGVTAQMRRAAVSIPANIAEGQGRHTDGEFLNQLSVAHGSVRELETHTMIAAGWNSSRHPPSRRSSSALLKQDALSLPWPMNFAVATVSDKQRERRLQLVDLTT